MGDAGLPSRLLASRFGSRWTYAGDAVAPGQIPAARMLDEFRFRDVGPRPRIYGVVGNNVMHSLSPVMHNAAFRRDGTRRGVRSAARRPTSTTFVTFAEAMRRRRRERHDSVQARRARAAATRRSTLTRDGRCGQHAATGRQTGRSWEATNTDVDGFLDSARARVSAARSRRRAAVLGAGGAARAVAVALTSRGRARDGPRTAHEQARDVAARSGRARRVATGAGRGICWSTARRLAVPNARDETPLPGGPFDGRLVYDLTYGAAETPLCAMRATAGCLTLDGLPMLIAQAERQFGGGRAAPAPGVMEAAAARRGAHRATRATQPTVN